MSQIGPIGERALAARKISLETAVRLGVFTGRSDIERGVIPDENGNVVAFPYFERGVVVAEKYRAPGKRFWQKPGGKRTFWNADVLTAPELEEGNAALIICEGELDALTAVDCGFPLSVSVPDGAPAVQDGEDPSTLPEVDLEAEKTGKFEFIWNNRDRLKKIKRFILAVDNDRPGRRLEAELLRRLSPVRCAFVRYPEGCKDLSDVRVKFGETAVVECLNAAKPYPIRGLYRLEDYPDRGEPETFSTGFPDLDENLKLWLGELIVVTGVPGHGKTTWINHLCVNLALAHNWSCALYSAEIPTVPSLRRQLRLAAMKVPASRWNRQTVSEADAWIKDHFVFIDDDPNGELEEDLTLEWLLERAGEAVWRYGIKVLVIDPWNEIEHARPPRESETEYHNRALRMLRRFAARHNIVLLLAAHPTKAILDDKGSLRVPSPYDISGSSAFYNKPDHVVVIHVHDPKACETTVYVKKCRFSWSGKKGDVTLRYMPEIEGYASLEGANPAWKSESVAF